MTEGKMTVSEVIRQYERDAEAVKERIAFVRAQMKADPDRSKMAQYRRRIETLYDELADMMYAIEQMLPYLEREKQLMGDAV